MKRIISLITIVVLLFSLCALASCGKDEATNSTTSSKSQSKKPSSVTSKETEGGSADVTQSMLNSAIESAVNSRLNEMSSNVSSNVSSKTSSKSSSKTSSKSSSKVSSKANTNTNTNTNTNNNTNNNSNEVSADVLQALSKSGTVSTYVFTNDSSIDNPSNLGGFNNSKFKKLFREVYGGELELKNIPWEGWESKFITDFAADDAPDVIYGFAKLWPKLANRGMVYSNKELKDLGIVGLDHPALQENFGVVKSNFTYKNEVYGFALHDASCFWAIVNEDLYKKYDVKSPSAYYEEGLWDMNALKESSNQLITAAGLSDAGVRDVFGYYCWDSTTFIRANGQQLIGFDPATGTLSNNCQKAEVVEAMEDLRAAFQDGWATTDSSLFKSGKLGVIAVDEKQLAANIKNLTFNWSIVPFPKGDANKKGQIPGSVSAWMVTAGSDNAQGAVNLIIAYKTAIADGTLTYGSNSIEYVLKDHPNDLKMIKNNRIHSVNDNMYGVGTLWSVQWDFWRQIRTGKVGVAETVASYSSMFDAQVEAEMS